MFKKLYNYVLIFLRRKKNVSINLEKNNVIISNIIEWLKIVF